MEAPRPDHVGVGSPETSLAGWCIEQQNQQCTRCWFCCEVLSVIERGFGVRRWAAVSSARHIPSRSRSRPRPSCCCCTAHGTRLPSTRVVLRPSDHGKTSLLPQVASLPYPSPPLERGQTTDDHQCGRTLLLLLGSPSEVLGLEQQTESLCIYLQFRRV